MKVKISPGSKLPSASLWSTNDGSMMYKETTSVHDSFTFNFPLLEIDMISEAKCERTPGTAREMSMMHFAAPLLSLSKSSIAIETRFDKITSFSAKMPVFRMKKRTVGGEIDGEFSFMI